VTRALIEQLPVEAKLLSEVTSVEVNNGRVESITINASDKITAISLFFVPAPIY